MSDEARAHYERGLALYGEKDYAGAIRELDAGYVLDPRREFSVRRSAGAPPERRLQERGAALQEVPRQRSRRRAGQRRAHRARALRRADGDRARAARDVDEGAPPIADVGAGASAAGSARACRRPGTRTPSVACCWARASPRSRPAPDSRWRRCRRATTPTKTLRAIADFTSRWSTAHGRSQIATGAFAAGAALTGVAIYRYWHVRRAHARASATPRLDAWAAPVTATPRRAAARRPAPIGGVRRTLLISAAQRASAALCCSPPRRWPRRPASARASFAARGTISAAAAATCASPTATAAGPIPACGSGRRYVALAGA